jgi:methylated-DNA-[protein]-cysteine S-methyltransferase
MRKVWIGESTYTPLGNIWVGVSENGLAAVEIQADQSGFIERLQRSGFQQVLLDQDQVKDHLQQLVEYLEGKRTHFDLPIDWSVMSPFQERALRATLAIPYGKTSTYGEIARQIGRPQSARAVGRAEATNPIPLVLPCHRVLGADGGLHGYGAPGGLETKAWLLNLEMENNV